jgi:APA family basic amino acid/polyamine antiporter
MARDGLLFSWLGDIHPRFRTPAKAIALQMVWSSVLVATGTFRILFTRVVFTEWIFFGLMAIGLIILRKRNPPGRRNFLRGSLFVPVLFSASSFAIVIHQLAANPGESLVGLALVLTGLPVYYLWKRKRGASP